MKILVSDSIHSAGIEILKRAGSVEEATNLTKEQLLQKVKEADALVVRSATQVTREVLSAGKKLRVIGRAGIGVDNIDVPSATERGIIVVNAPEASTITVAEHTIGLMLALARKISAASASTKAGKWEKKKFMGVELRGKTLGIIGLGRIGSQVAQKARAFEMSIVAYDPYINEKTAKALGVKIVALKELFAVSDFITIHVPLTEQTKALIDKDEIAQMKSGVYLINCSRGGIISESALYEAMVSGKVAGAALDVFEKEPPAGSPLLTLENFVATPHLGASTEEAQHYASTIVCEEVVKVLLNQPPKYAVNMPVLAPEVFQKIKPYMHLAESLGKFGIQLLKGRISEVSVTYCGRLAEVEALNVLTSASLAGLLAPILTEGVNLLNAAVIARNRGIRVTEAKREDAERFTSLIILSAKTDEDEIEVKGTLLGEEARIVGIESYTLDIIPKGKQLLVKHEDRPGMIGKIATVLGKREINIATMQVGRKQRGELQLMVLSVDQELSRDVVAELEKISGVKSVRGAKL